MWTYTGKAVFKGCLKYQIFDKEGVISYQKLMNNWIENESFRKFYNLILAQNKFESYYWENPPISNQQLAKPYEFVLVESTFLHNTKADEHTFKSHLKKKEPVVVFPNLNNDATLIVPTQSTQCKLQNYAYLASFVRFAPQAQVNNFWQTIGTELKKAITTQKKWLSTAGGGVYWLHARIDIKPKYYKYAPYRQ